MLKERIIDSGDCKYIGQFLKDLPDNVMLNKVTTGSGMTSVVLENEIKYVLAVPFVSLIKNKQQWCRARGIQPCAVFSGGADEKDVKAFIGNKIIVTYDSLKKVTKWLAERGDLLEWKLCVDESHKMVDSAAFRYDAIESVLDSYPKYKAFVFGTATPVNNDYQLPALRQIPRVKIQWANLETVKVNFCHYENKINDVGAVLAIDFINGEREGNAHIFINSVKSITDIVRKILKGGVVKHEDIRIVCADNVENENLIGMALSKEYFISPVGSEVKKVNFYTSTAFEGCDIYDEEGKSFILTDGRKDFTKIDIVTVLPQIIGRVRNSKYGNTIDLLFTKNKYICDMTEEEFKKKVLKDLSVARRDVISFNSFSKDSHLREMILSSSDTEYFIIDGNQLLINENAKYNEMNNFSTINNTYYVSKDGTKSTIINGVKSFNGIEYKYRGMERVIIKGLNKAKLGRGASFKDLCIDSIAVFNGESGLLRSAKVVGIKNKFPLIYQAFYQLGTEKMKALRYREKAIKSALLNISNELTCSVKIVKMLDLRIGVWYSVADMKSKLIVIYKELNINQKATSKDLYKWFNLSSTFRRINGKSVSGVVVTGFKIKLTN